MSDRSGGRRNPARYLAPLLILVIAGAVYVIVHRSLATSRANSANTGAQVSTGTVTTPGHGGPGHHGKGPKFYIVKPGDSLTAISVKTHVNYATILTLNPRLAANPGALQPGDRVRLHQ